MEIISSFLFGFIAMWIVIRFNYTKPEDKNLKQTMIEMVNTYSDNELICKELKDYSIKKIKNGNYEFIEVIDTIKRLKNDKARA